MRRQGSAGALRRASLAGALLLSLFIVPGALAGTSGKLSGRVLDAKKQPLVGANVAIPAARTGAVTDAEGRYAIIGVPAGTYEVKVNLLGYGPVAVTDVRINADNTTPLDVQLAEAPLLMKEVVVSAQRPVVDLKLTSTISTLSRDDLKTMPVQELQDVVNLQAGVVDGHFRGGRLGEVQYQVDGVSVNNSYDNTSSLRIDRSLIEEVQVISGTFDAEYGQAMSGVVNAVLRRGTDKFRWDAEALSGGYVFSGDKRGVAPEFDQMRLAGTQNYQASLSGPAGLPKTFFLLSGRHYRNDDYLSATRRFRPTDRSDLATFRFRPTGDGEQEPLGYSREWSGVGKLTNRSLPQVEMNYQAIVNVVDGRTANYAFRLDPDGMSKQHTFSIVHGLDWTHTLSKSTFYDLAVRQNYFDYRDMAYDDVHDRRYDAAGQPEGDVAYEYGAYVQGVDFTRFKQKTSTIVLKQSFVSQVTRDQQVKFGAEFEWPRVSFGNPGFLVSTQVRGRDSLVRHENEPPKYPGVLQYRPYAAAAFAQEDLEWNDLRIRAGLRFEYFNPRGMLPGDLANPAGTIAGQAVVPARATTRKMSLAPRLGVSYPVTRDAALFFAYGHFYQMAPLRDIFQNSDYDILRDLQSGGISYGVLGNPDIRPEKTVQYQFGYKQAVTEWLGVDLNLFYKDIRDLLGVEFISTYNDAEYARLTNVDFGNVSGFTVALEQRRRGLISTALDYTYQMARGNSSDPRETATRAEAGQDPRPRQIPFNWDQRHTLNLTLMVSRPSVFSVSSIVRVASGQPYTPAIASGFGGSLGPNSGHKPTGMVVDVRGEKSVRLGGLGANAFARVFNLFDTRFFNGFVFDNSGSAEYSRYPGTDRVQLANPTRFYGPRRIELGITLNTGAKGA
jgi:outer membrane receptor protein involved in Fe transport